MAESSGTMSTATATAANPLSNLPLKLHALLQAEDSSIVSWENGGKAFKVHDKERFVKEVMPKYFSTSNYQSFQRCVQKIRLHGENIDQEL